MDVKSTELEMVRFIDGVAMGAQYVNLLRSGNSQVKSMTLLDGFVRVRTNKGTMLVPLANVAFMVPAIVKSEELKK